MVDPHGNIWASASCFSFNSPGQMALLQGFMFKITSDVLD